MLLFSISFLIGISQLLWLPVINIYWLIFTVPFYIFVFLAQKRHFNLKLIILGVNLGFSWGLINGYIAKKQQLKTIPINNIEIKGTIIGLPVLTKLTDGGVKTKFSFKIDDENTELPIKKVLVSWYNSDQKIQAGQLWTLNLKLKPIHGYKNPGSFDYSKWLFRQGYDATATVKSAMSHQQSNQSLFNWVDQKRTDISQLIDESFQSPRVKGLIQALSIGDKSRISYQDSQLFQQTGTSHLIAISGLHIGLIAFIGLLFGRLSFYVFTFEKINRFNYEALFAIGFSLFYALLAGLSIPTVRALVMVMVFSISYASKMNITRWQAWSFAMLMVLLSDPFSVLDAGFWFSFTAVAVLMFAFTGRPLLSSKIMAFVKAQFVILIGLLPLMAIVFNQINFLTPIANLIVLPLASLLIIPLMFTCFLVLFFSRKMAEFLFQFLEQVSIYFFNILDYLQPFHFLSLPIQNVNSLTLLNLLMGMSILMLPRLFRWKILALILFVPLLLNKPNKLLHSDFKINILDVGQGLSIIIQTKDHGLIYDTGSKFESGFSMAQSVVLPYLQSQGINSIDYLILSHDDNDHSGGEFEIIERFNQIKVFGVKENYSKCQSPKFWQWDGVMFEVFSPFEIYPYLGNNSSCVIKVSSIYGSILLTGDIEEPVEYRLVNNFPDAIRSDVLLIPHHGSRSSSSDDFINQVNPKIAVNSSGFANQFNHPHPKIKQLYLDKNIDFYDTQDKGMIEMYFLDNGIKVIQYKDLNRHFWDIK